MWSVAMVSPVAGQMLPADRRQRRVPDSPLPVCYPARGPRSAAVAASRQNSGSKSKRHEGVEIMAPKGLESYQMELGVAQRAVSGEHALIWVGLSRPPF